MSGCSCSRHRVCELIRQSSLSQPLDCRPHWSGSVNQLGDVSAAGLQGVVGAPASVKDFRKVSGVAAIKAATSQLNARLAAQGVPLTAALC